MYRIGCRTPEIEAACRKPSCVYPGICSNLGTNHDPLIWIYRRARALKGIKKILIGSGLRYDLAGWPDDAPTQGALAKVLHEEAQPLGVRLQLLAIDSPVWTVDNAAHACTGWPSALAVGRNVVAMLAGHAECGRCVVAFSPPRAAPPHRLLAGDIPPSLVAPPLSGDGRPA